MSGGQFRGQEASRKVRRSLERFIERFGGQYRGMEVINMNCLAVRDKIAHILNRTKISRAPLHDIVEIKNIWVSLSLSVEHKERHP